jgi:hypothetical protein
VYLGLLARHIGLIIYPILAVSNDQGNEPALALKIEEKRGLLLHCEGKSE